MSEITVIIREGVAYVRRWNEKAGRYEEKKKTDQRLSDVLQFTIEIEKTTFGQFFEFVIREADLFQRVFNAALYGFPLGPYIDEIAMPAKPDPDLYRVEVYWYAYKPEFHGYGKWTSKVGGMGDGPVAIEYTPLYVYKDTPLVLNTNIDPQDMGRPMDAPEKNVLDFTVYGVLCAILAEITWSGDISKGRSEICAIAAIRLNEIKKEPHRLISGNDPQP